MKKNFFILGFFLVNLFVLKGQDKPEPNYDSMTLQLSAIVQSLEKENNILVRQLYVLQKHDDAILDSLKEQNINWLSEITLINNRLDSLIIQDSLQKVFIREIELSILNKIEDQQKSWLSIFIVLIIVLTLFFTGFFYRDYLLEKHFRESLSKQKEMTSSKIKRLKSNLLKMLKKSKSKKKK